MAVQALQSQVTNGNQSPEEVCVELPRSSLPKDPVDRVEGLLSEIVRYFRSCQDGLPAEGKRLLRYQDPGHVLTGLDALVRDRVLDDYLRQNATCLQTLQMLLGCRYGYLLRLFLPLEPDSTLEQNKANLAVGLDPPERDERVFVPRIGPLAEAFRPRNRDPDPEASTWVADYSTHPVKNTQALIPASALNDCLDALRNFEPVSLWDDWASEYKEGHASVAELNIVSRVLGLERSITAPTPDKLQEVVEAIPEDVREMLFRKFSSGDILADLAERMVVNEVASQIKTDGSIELRMDFECPPPTTEELTQLRARLLPSTGVEKPIGISTVHEFGRYPYKGSTIPLPQVLLPWAKNFLADEDVDRTVGWEEKFAQLTEYFAHLHHNFAGQDWGVQLRDAVGMLKTHWVFENYFYGAPKPTLDFPVNVWPKESKRLPRLAGPDIELRRESDEQRDLKGQRVLLHRDVVCAHDQQYEMPADVLETCYLRPYWDDAGAFWKGGQAERANLVNLENGHYEACMGGGMVQTAMFLSSKGRFRHDGTRVATQESLEAFAGYRGGRRAALQQCLNTFSSAENRRMCSPWRTLALPKPRRTQKPDAGIIFPCVMLPRPPEKGSRDPWAYTRAHRRCKREEEACAAWTRENAIKAAWKRKLAGDGGGPIMEMPGVWKGLYPPDVMDVEMKRRLELLRRCQVIRQGLGRAARRAPRPFMQDLLKMVGAGMNGEQWMGLRLEFGAHEVEGQEVVMIRPTEAAWLEYVCQPSANAPEELDGPVGRVGAILIDRVVEMMRDASPASLFRDMQPRSMDEFLREVNSVCGGVVGRYRFAEEDVVRLAPVLHSLKILSVVRSRDGDTRFARPETSFHPEDLIRWPSKEVKESNDSEKAISVKEGIPASIDDFAEYPEDMPRRQDVLSLEEHMSSPMKAEERKRTVNFFRCLAYRLGASLNGLATQCAQDEATMRDPALREQNVEFLGGMTRMWIDDTKGTTYADIIRMAESENEQEWNEQAREVVRRNMVRELCENKTMLWPLPLPSNPRVVRREPVWGFAHPSRKTAAHLFWDVNNWPLHLLSRETRERVRGRGARPKEALSVPPKEGEAKEVPYWKVAEGRRVFEPGSEYLSGDTPLQRKTIEDGLRRRFRALPKKRGWTERLAGVLFGDAGETELLPELDERWIPRSRPAKRARVSGARAGVWMTTMDNEVLTFEEERVREVLEELGVGGRKGGVWYDIQGGRVVYCKPKL